MASGNNISSQEEAAANTSKHQDEQQTSSQVVHQQQQPTKEEANNDNQKQTTHHDKSSSSSHQATEISLFKKLTVDSLLLLIRLLVSIFDLISRPVYYYKQQVYKKRHEVDEVERSQQLDPADPNSAWRQINIDAAHLEIEARIDTFRTYNEMMQSSFKAFGQQPCYGYREVLREQWTKRADSDKLFRQVSLSDYRWISFQQFERQIEAARCGFLLEGIRRGHKVMLYADTRPEWQIASQALIRLGAVVVTMYSTLGADGIVHSVNETQVKHVVAQKDKVSKLLKLNSKLPLLEKIIYFDLVLKLTPELGGQDDAEELEKKFGPNLKSWAQSKQTDFEHPQVECINFAKMLVRGQLADPGQVELLEGPGEDLRDKESIAVIMYTSGSTGIPKGVLISHGNIMATIKSFSYVTKDFVHQPQDNVCTAYLPLAHIFEFCIESVMLYHGLKFGFSTPHTLTDKSPGLLQGQSGDLTLLKPTVMIIVPLILDRIVQGVKQALKAQSYFKEQLVSYLIEYKTYWQQRHYETPLVDKIVCSKIAVALGGRAKYVICGSAPLSGETQTYVRAALNMKLPQGFGTTETCAATACQLFDDQSTCNVGLPVAGAFIKLEPWLEGNYRPTDRPHPRGEIVVGGQMIAHGYFNLDEQTKEAFYEDSQGVRWYRTGDIGEILPNGNLKIIDRKKDLVKLQNGEYISLGKVESTLKSNPYTDNFCVYANSNHNYIVALGPANEAAIRNLAQQIVDDSLRKSPSMVAKREDLRKILHLSTDQELEAIEELKSVLALYEADKLNNNQTEIDRNMERKMSSLSTLSTAINERLDSLCQNALIKARVLHDISELARERNLLALDIPKKFLLLAEEWTEDKNLVTAAMKIRRNFIYKRYEHELANLYSSKSS